MRGAAGRRQLAAAKPPWYIYHADSSAQKCEVLLIVSASDRDPLGSDLEAPTFVSRALSPRVLFAGVRRTYPRAHALVVVLRRRARRPRTGRILWRCLGSTRCWKRSLWCCCCPAEISRSYSMVEKYLFIVSEIFAVLAVCLLLDPYGLAFFGPCLPAQSDCWLLELG